MEQGIPGATIILTENLVDTYVPANNPVVGQTVLVSIRRASDGKWFDFIAVAWDTVAFGALGAEHKQVLADNGDGSYSVAWDQATADASAERFYQMHYHVTSVGAYLNQVDKGEWDFREAYRSPTAAANADAVWDEPSTGHVDAGKAGEQLFTKVDTITGDVAGLDGAAMRGTDGAITSLTGIATATNVSNAQTDIIAVLTAIKGVGWATETLHAIYDAIPVSGTGAYPITLYVKTSETPAVAIQNAKIRINATGGACVLVTNSLGAAVVNLDNGSYTVYVGLAASYTPAASYTVVVAGGVLTSPTGGILVVTAADFPDPPLSDEVTIYSDERDPVDNTLVGASDRTAYVASVEGASRYSAEQLSHFVALSDKGGGKNTDADGRWSMTLLAGATVVVKITDNTINKSEGWRVKLPEESGTYCLWRLSPTEVSLLY